MTPEQVSKLSDIELNRAMIWFYGDYVDSFCNEIAGDSIFSYAADILSDDGAVYTVLCGEWEYDVNFLSGYLSWDLTMPLAFRYKLCIDFNRGGLSGCAGHGSNGQFFVSEQLNPMRAIAEVLVMIKLNEQSHKG